ncbi:hypothetical protein ACHHYP_14322 [Achlya hypogyna]|uniref:Tudor-knot domain-containing protein n=1 Tax=Achlya hypogyna TaxID=1202772 RepID=A0A1V9YDH9_ACHHY|nr:hypothetical protein ACHHYP_14322 [Achlya hypogyna]
MGFDKRIRHTPGVYVDSKDERDDWCEAIVTHVNRTTNMFRVHFVGFGDNYNRWQTLKNLAPFRRRSSRSKKPVEPSRPVWTGTKSLFHDYPDNIEETTAAKPEKKGSKARKNGPKRKRSEMTVSAENEDAAPVAGNATREKPEDLLPRRSARSQPRSKPVLPVAAEKPSNEATSDASAPTTEADTQVLIASPTKVNTLVPEVEASPLRSRSKQSHTSDEAVVDVADAAVPPEAAKADFSPLLVPDVVHDGHVPVSRTELRKRNLQRLADAKAFMTTCILEFRERVLTQ